VIRRQSRSISTRPSVSRPYRSRTNGVIVYKAGPPDESGRFEVYVRSFPSEKVVGSPRFEQRWLVSKGASGGINWRADGRELTYVASDGNVMAVEVMTSPTFSFGVAKPLFMLPPGVIAMDQSTDGQRWLVGVPVALSTPTPFTVLLNWFKK